MKAPIFLLHCSALVGAVFAQSAYLFTIDQSPRSPYERPATVSASTAYSIIARRRSRSEPRYLQNVADDVLRQIEGCSGHQVSLFGDSRGQTPAKVFIRISGYDGDTVFEPAQSSIAIVDPSRDLLLDLKPIKEEYCIYGSAHGSEYSLTIDGEADVSYNTVEMEACRLVTNFWTKQNQEPFGSLSKAIRDFETAASAKEGLTFLLHALQSLTRDGVESTLLLLPSKLATPKHQVSRREESPLDLPPTILPASSPSTLIASNHTLPHIIPACFSSASACENTTNYCSGHGSCVPSHGSKSCYKCTCRTTIIRQNSDGTKKTQQWGGGACQKKDVSVPFFLFASFGVAMSALIAGAIGMLYSMGSEELPSVIGAGVAGPRVQK